MQQLVVRIYNGFCPSVDVPLDEALEDGTSMITAIHGEPAEFPVETAERLDPSGDWLLEDHSLPEAAKPHDERVFTAKELRVIAEEHGIDVPKKATKADIEVLIKEHSEQLGAAGENGAQSPSDGDQASTDASATAGDGE